MEFGHHRWLSVFDGKSHPPTTVYTIGNPFTAQALMQHDLHLAYYIPPRLLIAEKADGSGTNVIYHLPSSIMVVEHNPELLAAVKVLDGKIDRLISKVTAVGGANTE